MLKDSYVIELASNDGYLLQHVQALGIPCLGIDRYMASRFRWLRLAGYALDPEEFGKSGRLLGVFRTSELLKVALWPKGCLDVPQQTWDLLMMRRILAVGQIKTTDSSTLFKRIGSTTVDFDAKMDKDLVRRNNRISRFLNSAVADQQGWYRLYASDSLQLYNYEKVLIFAKSLRVIRRQILALVRAQIEKRQITT